MNAYSNLGGSSLRYSLGSLYIIGIVKKGLNVLALQDYKVLGIMIWYTYGLLLDLFEGTYMVSFIGHFDGTRYGVGGVCVGMIIRGIMTASEILYTNLRD